jgi:hypothetical protein
MGKPIGESPEHILHVVLVSGKDHELATWAEEVVFEGRKSTKLGSWSSATGSGV